MGVSYQRFSWKVHTIKVTLGFYGIGEKVKWHFIREILTNLPFKGILIGDVDNQTETIANTLTDL